MPNIKRRSFTATNNTTPRDMQRAPYPVLNSPSATDLYNYLSNANLSKNDHDSKDNSPLRAVPLIRRRSNNNNNNNTINANPSYNSLHRNSLNSDHSGKELASRSSNDFNNNNNNNSLRSASRTSFRDVDDEDDYIDHRNVPNHAQKNSNYPVPTPRKRFENVTQAKSNLTPESNDFRIRRFTGNSASRGAMLVTGPARVSSYTPSSPRLNSNEPDKETDISSPPSYKYQRQKSAISLKPNDFYEARNGRLSSLNHYSNSGKTSRANGETSNGSYVDTDQSRHRNSTRNSYVNEH